MVAAVMAVDATLMAMDTNALVGLSWTQMRATPCRIKLRSEAERSRRE
jgi:hypothetical protein